MTDMSIYSGEPVARVNCGRLRVPLLVPLNPACEHTLGWVSPNLFENRLS